MDQPPTRAPRTSAVPQPASSGDPSVEPPTTGSLPALSPAQVALLTATERLRQELAAVELPFALPGVSEALAERDEALERLDTFVLPRLRRLDAPLLVVIGGSAGSGKSTLTNSLVGVEVSQVGVLRPTTREPVLAHHPRDAGAFLSRRILPGLARTTAAGRQPLEPGVPADSRPGSIRLVPHWAVAPGLAVIDSPDLNSRSEGNRELARQLFGVADLWVFVATPADYANAAPWELLTEAVQRQVSVAVVLNRARDAESSQVRHHFATMLRDAGLASAAFFTLPETVLDDGMLPSWRMVAMHTWLARQVGDVQARDGHVRRAVSGTIGYLTRHCDQLLAAVHAQADLHGALREDLHLVLGPARDRLDRGVQDGSMIVPAMEAAWRQATADPAQTPRPARWRSRSGSGTGLVGRVPLEAAAEAAHAGMVELVRTQGQAALDRLADRWHGRPAISELAERAALFTVPEDFRDRAGQILLRWQAGVRGRVPPAASSPASGEQAGPDGSAGSAAAAIAVTTLALGAEAGWIGTPARALAETLLSRQQLRDHVELARRELRTALHAALAVATERPRDLLDELGPGPDRPRALGAALADLRQTLAALDRAE